MADELIYHDTEVINAFSNLLEYAINLKRNSVIPHIKYVSDARQPQDTDKRIFYFPNEYNNAYIKPENVTGPAHQYQVCLRKHYHTINPHENEEAPFFVFFNNDCYRLSSGTLTLGADGINISTDKEGIRIGRNVVEKDEKVMYFPPAVCAEQIKTTGTPGFIKHIFKPKDISNINYYKTFKKGIEFLEEELKESENVIVLVKDEEHAEENSIAVGLLGNFNGDADEPDCPKHEHSVFNAAYEGYNPTYNYFISGEHVKLVHLCAEQSTVQSSVNTNGTCNEWLFPENSIGFAKIVPKVENKLAKKMPEHEARMKEYLKTITDKTGGKPADITEIKKDWTTERKHSDGMFAAAAQWIFENLKILEFPVGTLTFEKENINDERFIRISQLTETGKDKLYTVIHVGKRTVKDRKNANIKYHNKEEIRFKHGIASHTHGWLLKNTPSTILNGYHEKYAKSGDTDRTPLTSEDIEEIIPDDYDDKDYTTFMKLGDSGANKELWVYDPKGEWREQ